LLELDEELELELDGELELELDAVAPALCCSDAIPLTFGAQALSTIAEPTAPAAARAVRREKS
jgi:hypothetical protein